MIEGTNTVKINYSKYGSFTYSASIMIADSLKPIYDKLKKEHLSNTKINNNFISLDDNKDKKLNFLEIINKTKTLFNPCVLQRQNYFFTEFDSVYKEIYKTYLNDDESIIRDLLQCLISDLFRTNNIIKENECVLLYYYPQDNVLRITIYTLNKDELKTINSDEPLCVRMTSLLHINKTYYKYFITFGEEVTNTILMKHPTIKIDDIWNNNGIDLQILVHSDNIDKKELEKDKNYYDVLKIKIEKQISEIKNSVEYMNILHDFTKGPVQAFLMNEFNLELHNVSNLSKISNDNDKTKSYKLEFCITISPVSNKMMNMLRLNKNITGNVMLSLYNPNGFSRYRTLRKIEISNKIAVLLHTHIELYINKYRLIATKAIKNNLLIEGIYDRGIDYEISLFNDEERQIKFSNLFDLIRNGDGDISRMEVVECISERLRKIGYRNTIILYDDTNKKIRITVDK